MVTAGFNLWPDSLVRDSCLPSCRQHHSRSNNHFSRSQQRAVQACVSANVSFGPSATQAAPLSSSSPTKSNWSMETVDEEWTFESKTVGLSSSKALKINMDLKLYRARLARMQAALSTVADVKRTLLRDAEDSLRACLRVDPADPRSYVVLGKLLVQQKRYDEARKLYADGTTATGNTSPYIWASWGYLESITGNVSRARKLFDASIVVDETHAAAWHKWGMLEMRQGNYLRARDLWTTGIQQCSKVTNRSTTYLYCSLAVMAAELGKLSEARAWFQEGTRLVDGRSSCALWHAWAMTEARLGDASAVRYLFKRALQANPRSRYSHLAWAMWERQQGNPSACMQLLTRGSSLNPADPALYQARAIVEKEWRHYDAARSLFQQGLAVDPRHLYLWQAWGVMEHQLGNFQEARRLFQEGVWADPGNKDAVYIFQAWGVLEREAGNAPLARELFKAALKVDAKNEATWSSWVQMEEDLGCLEAANELRIRSTEQQWEFVVPASFSTRTSAGQSSDGSNGLLQSLANTLNRFFSVRAGGRGGASTDSSATADASSSLGRQQLISELLPADYRTDLTLSDIIDEASALDGASSSGGSSGTKAYGGSLGSIAPNRKAGSRGLKNGDSRLSGAGLLPRPQQQPEQPPPQQQLQQPQQQLQPQEGEEQPPQVVLEKQTSLTTASGSVQGSSKGVLPGSLVRSGGQQLMYREAGLKQRPVRPPNRE